MPETRRIPKGIDRRIFPRQELHVTVEGRRVDHSIHARRDPRVSLQIRDLSAGGLSALTSTPVAVGERVAVYFPPQGPRRGWDAFGRVIRIEPSSFGYRVALEFEDIAAAA
jgi:hypothetical protein